MSRTVSGSSVKNRPSPLSSKSFARYEPAAPSPPPGRSRASTVQSPVTLKSPQRKTSRDDVFEKKNEEEEEPVSPSISKSTSLPDKFDELPIELASLTDRFVESLSARVYNEPPSVDQLADLFQEFYIRATASISIHISALMSKLNRASSPTLPSTASRSRGASQKSSADSLTPPARSGSQQLLTASEVTEKRKARRLLEYKRILLEESVERKVCDKIYDKIWKHKSTLDEVRDEKLRSKTAALALVGIGLKDLGIEADEDSEKTLEDVQESLSPAREGLARMTEEHCPLGKLQHLTAAHKAIVDTLYSIHPSSASADDILPTLIYSLITSPVEGIDAISNLNFIQRFRTASKIDGEAAYCMTNLEAAISFLENVDLASLRADEVPEGPQKTSALEFPTEEKLESFPTLPITTPSPSIIKDLSSPTHASATGIDPSPMTSSKASLEKQMALPQPRHQRTLSDILQPISNAPEAVRASAEESLKNISSTLDSSFKFFFGKIREQQTSDANSEVIVPKTLDEARLLVSRPLTPDGDEMISETSSLAGDSTNTTPPSGPTSKLSQTEDKILSLIGGRRRTNSLIRDRSVDSERSTASNSSTAKRVAFASTGSSSDLAIAPSSSTSTIPQKPLPAPTPTSQSNPLDPLKSFGATINPINHLASFGNTFRSFGNAARNATGNAMSPVIPPTPTSTPANMNTTKTLRSNTSANTTHPNTNHGFNSTTDSAVPEISLRPPMPHEILEIKSQPPNARYLAMEDAGEMKVGEVQDLLREFQRVARVLGGLLVVGEEESGMS